MGPKLAICPEQIFFGIDHCYYFYLPTALFTVQHLKEILQWIQNYDDAPFFGLKVVHLPQINFFFRKSVNEPCFFIHAYIHAENQSQILIY